MPQTQHPLLFTGGLLAAVGILASVVIGPNTPKQGKPKENNPLGIAINSLGADRDSIRMTFSQGSDQDESSGRWIVQYKLFKDPNQHVAVIDYNGKFISIDGQKPPKQK